jgi:TPR repeat protein
VVSTTPEQERAAEALRSANMLIFEEGDERGIGALESLAAEGFSAAMVMLGNTFELSRFRDLDKAERWYRAAYDTNPTAFAIYSLGRFYVSRHSDEEARALFAEGAAAGDGLCKYWLALSLCADETLKVPKKEIRDLLEQASREGFVVATRLLGDQLIRGQYVERNLLHGLFVRLILLPIKFLRILSRNPKDWRLKDL